MKVGVNARLLLSGHLEGLARYTIETVAEMAKSHPEDEFLLFFDQKVESKYLLYPNIKGVLVYCPTRHPILILLWFELFLPFYLKKYNIDVFYSADNFLSLRSKIPSLLICHDLAFKHIPEGIKTFYLKFYKIFTPYYLKKCTALGTVSNFVSSDIKSTYSLDKSIFIAPNALPKHNFGTNNNKIISPISKPYFIYVGSIHPRKNIESMLTAFVNFNETQNNQFAFVLIGRMAWGNKNILPFTNYENIHFLQDVEDEAKLDYIKQSIALVYISLNEGFGIPILEGFSCQIPVITSNISSMPEVANGASLLVDPYNIDDIAHGYHHIVSDKELCAHLIKKGNQRLQDFNWTQSAAIIYEQMKSINQKYEKR
ncbi:MAG TPA: glycosyltransferase family 1 protein [Saprospiraceae bacterium]|nr:glycosyltransferase family 1 protein [Saprospiraceae bacterium]